MNKKIFDEMVLLNEQTWERLSSIMQSEDDIGVVLRLHLVTEKIIEAWCCAASNNVNFFDGFGENLTMSYAAKLKLATNFGLNEFSEITNEEINKLITLISKGDQRELIENPKFGILIGDKGIHLNDEGISNREKFIASIAAVILRIAKQVNDGDKFIKLL